MYELASERRKTTGPDVASGSGRGGYTDQEWILGRVGARREFAQANHDGLIESDTVAEINGTIPISSARLLQRDRRRTPHLVGSGEPSE